MAAQTYDVTVTGAGNASLRRSRRARKRQKSFAFGKRARASRGGNTRFSGGGITFTFGGLTTTGRGEVLNTEGNVIKGIFAAGEIPGGLFLYYLVGAGLMKGAVFGRITETNAAFIGET